MSVSLARPSVFDDPVVVMAVHYCKASKEVKDVEFNSHSPFFTVSREELN